MIWINIGILLLNLFILWKNSKMINDKIEGKFPKWEYFADGIRFFNKKGESTIEHDKPLIK